MKRFLYSGVCFAAILTVLPVSAAAEVSIRPSGTFQAEHENGKETMIMSNGISNVSLDSHIRKSKLSASVNVFKWEEKRDLLYRDKKDFSNTFNIGFVADYTDSSGSRVSTVDGSLLNRSKLVLDGESNRTWLMNTVFGTGHFNEDKDTLISEPKLSRKFQLGESKNDAFYAALGKPFNIRNMPESDPANINLQLSANDLLQTRFPFRYFRVIQNIEKEARTQVYVETGKYPAYQPSAVFRDMIYSVEYDTNKSSSKWQVAVTGNIRVIDKDGLDYNISYGFSRQDVVPGEKAARFDSTDYFSTAKDGKLWHFTVAKSF